MKLPALAIATAFALGIACGLSPEIAHRSSHGFVAFLLCSAVTFLLIGFVFVWCSRVVVAGVASVLCWAILGVVAVCIEEQPRRADHILSLVDAGKINLISPLRYYGRLADEPEKLPWGAGYDIKLSGVDYEGLFVPASGGLRLGYIERTDHRGPVALHAGDSIAVLTRAKLPQLYRDEGAFDRRAYLSQQGVDLVGALRARRNYWSWLNRLGQGCLRAFCAGDGDCATKSMSCGRRTRMLPGYYARCCLGIAVLWIETTRGISRKPEHFTY
ncbi:MAG TPA: ComEC/Rec2 family competence protein [Candidatus Dormibacteraeota bacterium]|jgi:hypothetical protein|nr:ComEC/Rec2 family competence protein [Candidatus Dormibacteraeota bacterium]